MLADDCSFGRPLHGLLLYLGAGVALFWKLVVMLMYSSEIALAVVFTCALLLWHIFCLCRTTMA